MLIKIEVANMVTSFFISIFIIYIIIQLNNKQIHFNTFAQNLDL